MEQIGGSLDSTQLVDLQRPAANIVLAQSACPELLSYPVEREVVARTWLETYIDIPRLALIGALLSGPNFGFSAGSAFSTLFRILIQLF
ncbi:MAG: hypothetical protein ABGX07_17755, partial [Pirellulaceae bacterium]